MRNINQLSLFLLFITISITANAQQMIGIGGTPDSNAVLHLHVMNPTKPQGLILPNLNTSQINALGSIMNNDEKGMLVYDTDSACTRLWTGSNWQKLIMNDINGWNLNLDSISTTHKVGIGITNPRKSLDVKGTIISDSIITSQLGANNIVAVKATIDTIVAKHTTTDTLIVNNGPTLNKDYYLRSNGYGNAAWRYDLECPANFTMIDSMYCMENTLNDASPLNWIAANRICTQKYKGTLCPLDAFGIVCSIESVTPAATPIELNNQVEEWSLSLDGTNKAINFVYDNGEAGLEQCYKKNTSDELIVIREFRCCIVK